MIFEPLSVLGTPRKCCVCMRAASMTGFKRSKLGGIDRSSKQYFCDKHFELYSEPVSPSE